MTVASSLSYKLPDEPVFHRLIENSKSITRVVVNDPTCNVQADCSKLLRDVVAFRKQLYEALPSDLFDKDGIIGASSPYIVIVSPANYEFIVASFAILSVGGAIVPISPGVLPEEAMHFLGNSQSSVLVTTSQYRDQGTAIHEYAKSQGYNLNLLLASLETWDAPQETNVEIDPTLIIDSSRPSLVVYSSGTTGRPKGVVQSRPYFAFGYRPTSQDLVLTLGPAHWIGVLRSTMYSALSGTPQEMIEPNEVVIWERLRKGGVTILWVSIPLWSRLQQHYYDVLSRLPQADLDLYLEGAKSVQLASVGGAAPMPSLLRFWRHTIGIPLEVAYGCTELGGPTTRTDSSCDRELKFSIGKPSPGVELKLSEGSEGEILMKSSLLFSGYLGDEAKTKESMAADGFFKTGDYARRVGDEYVMEGRVSTDFIRSGPFKIPIVEVETRLSEVSFVTEACIVSIPDRDVGNRVAALVRFRPGFDGNLAIIRDALSEDLALYNLPTALRVLAPGEVIPATDAGKVVRQNVVQQYFTPTGDYELALSVEVWDLSQKQQKAKAWDWNGVQLSPQGLQM
ncbi:hypothetical protein NXS19_013828 [Fusarium pseudograminearum]|uniref:AMP-dependent synthetase/ligase domain-containing protein n=1 Tax=Fusarium pseudograminearum (strain CS3096) TaxID=1028729 RepID=K3VZ67_FUSPC|nr:hypothetical protein FPSE_07971 [Fusarium pseudograminearum CS3096]EKJ71870.1 hypothetical protein FPSE_07971 [Fusarium pseudograminearum CS3096]KAF0642073.1 hypothetical protein FPSE5266_07971 [Fusarium pseudograminearum]UZP46016.1 hypothetical protein NXS19_013828 [Fusarium pseudograminearum]